VPAVPKNTSTASTYTTKATTPGQASPAARPKQQQPQAYPSQLLQPVNLAQLTPAQQQQVLLQQQQLLQQQAQLAGVNLLPQYMQLLTSTLQTKPINSTGFVNPMMQAPLLVNPSMLQPTPTQQQAQKLYSPTPSTNLPATKQPTANRSQQPVSATNRTATNTTAPNNQLSVVLNSNVVNAGSSPTTTKPSALAQPFSGSLLADFDVNSALNNLTLNQQITSQTSPLPAAFNPNTLPWSLSSLTANTTSTNAAEDANGDFEEAINAFRNKNMYQDDEGALLPASLMDSIEDKMLMSGTPNMNWDPAAFDNGSNFAPIPFKGSSSPRSVTPSSSTVSPGSLLLGTASPNLGSGISPSSTPTPFNLNPSSGQHTQTGLNSMFWNNPSSQALPLGTSGSTFDSTSELNGDSAQKLNRDFVKDDPVFKSTRQPFVARNHFDMNKRVALAFDAIRHRHLEKQSSGRLTPIPFTQWWLSMVTIDPSLDLQLLNPPKDLVSFMRDMEKRGFIV